MRTLTRLALVLVAACGAGSSADGGSDSPRDAGADAGPIRCEVHPDCPDGSYCRLADGGYMCVAPSAEPVPCTMDIARFPQHGDVCAEGELPEGHTCRLLYCNGGCYPTCDCIDGRWWCGDACIDWAPPGASYCGRWPVCIAFSVCSSFDRSGDFTPCLIDLDCPDGQRCSPSDGGHGRCEP